MAGQIQRFRCYQCGKLLGAPASKAGRTTSCPNCKAELIVPSPDAEPDLGDAIRSLTPGIDESVNIREPEPTRLAPHDPEFSWEQIDTAIFRAAGASEPVVINAPTPDPDIVTPAFPPISIAPTVVDVDLSAIGSVAPALPEINVDARPAEVDRPARRQSGDVVLSQSVLASWSIFVLMALGIAFLAGLFTGHYFWKP